MNIDKMKCHEIIDAIGEALSPEAQLEWNGMDDGGKNDFLIHAQREGFDAAVQLFEETAKPEHPELSAAIERSTTYTEITAAEFSGDEADLLVALDGLYDGEIDSVRENDGTIDCWGFTDDMPEGEMAWRLKVTLIEESSE